MFAFWGEISTNECVHFDRLSGFFSEIEPSPLVLKYEEDFHVCIGQSPNPSFFLYQNPFIGKTKKSIYAVQGYLWVEDHLPKDLNQTNIAIEKYGDELIENRTLTVHQDRGGLFLLAAVDLPKRVAMITSDYSGLIPLYYLLTSSGNLIFSTHILPLSKVVSAPVDEVGVIHHSAFHHTIGKRTLYKGISRLNPGETLIYESGKELSFNQADEFYSQVVHFKSDEESADAIWEIFMRGSKPFAGLPGKRGVFLSGGLDSRLVVSAFSKLGETITPVSLGDKDNYEIGLARRVSESLNSPLTIHPLVEDYNLNDKLVEKLTNSVEFLNFPHYYPSPQILLQNGATTASTGHAGESYFGGQAYGFLGSDWSQKNRFKFVIARSLGLPVSLSKTTDLRSIGEIRTKIAQYYTAKVDNFKNYMSENSIRSFSNGTNELLSDIDQELHRYSRSNPSSALQVIERFWIEHHELKQFGRQNLTIMASLPLILPTVFPPFLQVCTNLDPTRKVDHGIYLKLVQRHLGNLARIPTANIPINLMNPELILWLSRAWRAKEDQKITKMTMSSKGQSTVTRHGWSNYEVWLRESNFFDTCMDYISPEIYSHEALQNKIDLIKQWKKRVYSGQEFLTMMTISQLVT